MIYAPDANILSYAMKGLFSLRKKLQTAKDKDALVITPISYYEVMRGLAKKNASKSMMAFDKEYLSHTDMNFGESDWRKAIEVYTHCVQTGHIIDDDDILQAGYCINHGYTLVTHNVKHFEGIPSLQFVDWVEDGGTDMSKGSVYD